jgi:hypothetical protein
MLLEPARWTVSRMLWSVRTTMVYGWYACPRSYE